jgi:hypothetical protein
MPSATSPNATAASGNRMLQHPRSVRFVRLPSTPRPESPVGLQLSAVAPDPCARSSKAGREGASQQKDAQHGERELDIALPAKSRPCRDGEEWRRAQWRPYKSGNKRAMGSHVTTIRR